MNWGHTLNSRNGFSGHQWGPKQNDLRLRSCSKPGILILRLTTQSLVKCWYLVNHWNPDIYIPKMTDKDRTREALGPSVHSFCTGPRKWSYDAEQEFKRGSVKSDNSTMIFCILQSHVLLLAHYCYCPSRYFWRWSSFTKVDCVNSLNPCSWAAAKWILFPSLSLW